MVEGSLTKPLNNKRSDPLSPILFDMVMIVLSRMINIKMEAKKINTSSTNLQSISHLMYADDPLLFSKANPKSKRTIKEVHEEFSDFSCLSKTKIQVRPREC